MERDVNPIDVEKFLKESRFPSNRDDLVRFARDHHAPDNILSALKGIPDRKYRDPADAARETFYSEDELPRGLDSCDD